MSEIRPRFYVHIDNEKWIIVRMGGDHIVFGSATSSTPVWQAWHGWHDKNVEDGVWVEITYTNMRPPTRELDDLKAGMKEKIRLVEDLRAELDSESLNVQTLEQKLKHLQRDLDEAKKTITSLNQGCIDRDNRIDGLREQINHLIKHLTTPRKQDEQSVAEPSTKEERVVNKRLEYLERQNDVLSAKISRIDSNVGSRLQKIDDRIGKIVDDNYARFREIKESLEGLVRETAKQITDLRGIVDQNKIVSEAGKTALQDRMHRIDVAVIEQKKATDGAQRIEASRHEALRQRVEKIERVVPPGSGNLQTIVENLADRMAADPKNAFQTYVDQRIQRISSWFDMKLSALGDQRIAHTALSDRVVVTERKIEALEGSDNAMFEDLQNQIDTVTASCRILSNDLNRVINQLTEEE